MFVQSGLMHMIDALQLLAVMGVDPTDPVKGPAYWENGETPLHLAVGDQEAFKEACKSRIWRINFLRGKEGIHDVTVECYDYVG